MGRWPSRKGHSKSRTASVSSSVRPSAASRVARVSQSVSIGSEITDSEKEPILRAYLKRWKWEVGQFFGGVDAESPSADVRRIAPGPPDLPRRSAAARAARFDGGFVIVATRQR